MACLIALKRHKSNSIFSGMTLVKLQQVSLYWLGGDGLFCSFCLRQCPQFPMDCYRVTLFIAFAPFEASHVASQQHYTAHLFSCFLSSLSFSQTHLRCNAIRGDYVHPLRGHLPFLSLLKPLSSQPFSVQ